MAIQSFLRLDENLSLYEWHEARDKYGKSILSFIMLLQFILVPFHMLSTDYLDDTTRFSVISLSFRLGAVFLFFLTYIVVKKYHLHSDYYYGITFFINAMSDAYVSVYSSQENIITHMLGYGVVMIAYSVLMVLPPLLYNGIMLFSTIFLFSLQYLFSTSDFITVLENGGAFILFFIFICPILNLFRYESLRNSFLSLKVMNNLNQELQEKQEEITLQKENLEIANKQLNKKNRDITASITYAARLQKGILPSSEIIKNYFSDHFILYQPRNIVSGDFYWFAQTDDRIVFVVADCTGHGVPGALMSMIAHAALNKIFFEKKVYSPDTLFQIASDEIRQNLDQNTNKSSDGMDASAFTYFPKENKLTLATAKSSIFYVKNNDIIEIKGDNHSIGGYVGGENRNFTLHQLSVDQPLTIYMFSDGYHDQFGGSQNKKITKQGFRQILLDIHQKPMEDQKIYLQTFLKNWIEKGNEQQIDDILVIGLKINPL